jgi:hypothetical protein
MKKLISVFTILSISVFAFGCKKGGGAGDDCKKLAPIIKKCFDKEKKLDVIIKECEEEKAKKKDSADYKTSVACLNKHSDDCKAIMKCMEESAKEPAPKKK